MTNTYKRTFEKLKNRSTFQTNIKILKYDTVKRGGKRGGKVFLPSFNIENTLER